MTHRDTSSHPSCPQDTLLRRFGATLRQYRRQRGLTHRALAAKTGIRYAYISQIELGKRNIAVLTLLRMTEVLGIPPAWLLTPLDPLIVCESSVSSQPLPSTGAREEEVPADNRCAQPADPAVVLALLGTTIRQYRQQQRLTQRALAAQTGLSPTYLGQIEHGRRNLSVLNLVRIAEVLGIAVSHLLTPSATR